jgi:hypothetical protein
VIAGSALKRQLSLPVSMMSVFVFIFLHYLDVHAKNPAARVAGWVV